MPMKPTTAGEESIKEMGSPEEMRPGRPQRNYPAQERKRLLSLFEHSGLSAVLRGSGDTGLNAVVLGEEIRSQGQRRSGGGDSRRRDAWMHV